MALDDGSSACDSESEVCYVASRRWRAGSDDSDSDAELLQRWASLRAAIVAARSGGGREDLRSAADRLREVLVSCRPSSPAEARALAAHPRQLHGRPVRAELRGGSAVEVVVCSDRESPEPADGGAVKVVGWYPCEADAWTDDAGSDSAGAGPSPAASAGGARSSIARADSRFDPDPGPGTTVGDLGMAVPRCVSVVISPLSEAASVARASSARAAVGARQGRTLSCAGSSPGRTPQRGCSLCHSDSPALSRPSRARLGSLSPARLPPVSPYGCSLPPSPTRLSRAMSAPSPSPQRRQETLSAAAWRPPAPLAAPDNGSVFVTARSSTRRIPLTPVPERQAAERTWCEVRMHAGSSPATTQQPAVPPAANPRARKGLRRSGRLSAACPPPRTLSLPASADAGPADLRCRVEWCAATGRREGWARVRVVDRWLVLLDDGDRPRWQEPLADLLHFGPASHPSASDTVTFAIQSPNMSLVCSTCDVLGFKAWLGWMEAYCRHVGTGRPW